MNDLELRIFAPREEGYPVEAEINGSGSFRGTVRFEFEALRKTENVFAYGRALRDFLLSSRKIQQAFHQAMAGGGTRIRILVDRDAEEARELHWERLMLDIGGQDQPAAASPQTPLSRYMAIEQEEPAALEGQRFRLLLAIANPSDLKQLTPLDVNAEIESLLGAWANLLWMGELHVTVLPGQAGVSQSLKDNFPDCQFIDGPATIDKITELLQDRDGLHLISHGNLTRDRKAILILEKADGTVATVDEELLAPKLNLPSLRFVFLHSCKGTGGGAQIGLGPRLVQQGVAAVVAMQDFVPMGDARQFATGFYASLMRDGAVDVAVNAGRQAILRAGSNNWLIPVLFSRLQAGRIWAPDPLRSATRRLAEEFRQESSIRNPFPVDVILVRSGVTSLQHGMGGVSGPRLGILEASLEVLQHQTPVSLLIGNRGRAKSAHLKRLFVECSDRFLKDPFPEPVLVAMKNFAPTSATPARTMMNAVVRTYADHGCDLEPEDVLHAMANRQILFLLDDDDLGPEERCEALKVLETFRQQESTHSHQFYLTVDESTFDAATYPDESVVLIIQLMTPAQVDAYLEKQEEAVKKLGLTLRETALYDVAAVPWLLSGLIRDARSGIPLRSRSGALERFVREGLSHLKGPAGLRSRTEEALSRMAWQMQTTRQVTISGADLFMTLSQVRGHREFPIEEFLTQMLGTGLLAKSGDEAVRFAYPGLQSYYAARHLTMSRDRDQWLEDITATLGRFSRLTWWEDTLAILAGLMDSADALLRKVLAGSGLLEGDQVFVATRCLHEARCAGRTKPEDVGQDVVDQILDTLLWRAHPANVRQTSERLKAIEAMGILAETRVIPFLVSQAIHRIRRDWDNRPCFDYSSARQAAVMSLTGMQSQTLEYVTQDPVLGQNQVLQRLIGAWLKQDIRQLGELLDLDDAVIAPVAAIALGTIKSPESLDLLLLRYSGFDKRLRDPDILWAVTDTLCIMDPISVNERAVLPFLDRPEWSSQVAYLIGKLGLASLGGPEHRFLERCMQTGDGYLQGRALRAAAMVLSLHRENEASGAVMADARELCHHLALDELEEAAKHKLVRISPELRAQDRWQLRYQALESLRSIGDETSIEVLRRVRRQYEMGRESGAVPPLSQLSFDIGEEIYWRLTGGLSAETFLPLKPKHKPN